MCYGFGGLVLRDGSIRWVEPDSDGCVSHSDILDRLETTEKIKLEDSSDSNRPFVRFEFPELLKGNKGWDERSFRWDESSTLPVWLNEDEAKEKAIKLMLRVAPFYKVCADKRERTRRYYTRRYDGLDYYTDPDHVKRMKLGSKWSNRLLAIDKDLVSQIKSITGYVSKGG